ncbi:HlyD family secretion protein [Legionella fallonii]|uniref:Putative HlyD family secretion protein n=1 Tax=Legionella fallonii LLAP-10 TaxID=1212491 RepID=A0A098G9D5_9GAMM|nr:efflux RND transporter periplasmic adaptor subunit [Legionella fallonii]CEG58619.1 putative HlyD family secretion protein [Legionella fallonii LLAP-10]
MTIEEIKKRLMTIEKKTWVKILGILVIVIVGFIIWYNYLTSKNANIISGNGRIEATEINIAPRMPGKVKDIFVDEGDYVKVGQVLVQMETDVLDARLKEAKGQLLMARSAVAINQSKLNQSKNEKVSADAVLKQREAEFEVAKKRLRRSSKLVLEGATSKQEVDDNKAAYESAIAAKNASFAHVEAAQAAIVTAEREVIGAEAAVTTAKGSVERVQADINDSALKTPRDGRVQYRVAQPGEVVSAGSPVLNLVDLSDVYMTFFLPTVYAGRVAIGEEARIVLDAAPQDVIPANISFISDVAQFTPKTVETTSEREKLMFRIKARIPKELLQKHIALVKTGLPGMTYIRLNPQKPWPDYLRLNPNKPWPGYVKVNK